MSFPKVKPIRDKESLANYARDHNRCETPFLGPCTPNWLETHHIVYKSGGGGDNPENLIRLCKRHHDLVHSNKRKYQPILINLKNEVDTSHISNVYLE